MKPHTEAAFETVLVDALLAGGYEQIDRAGFDRERAIFPEVVLGYRQGSIDLRKSLRSRWMWCRCAGSYLNRAGCLRVGAVEVVKGCRDVVAVLAHADGAWLRARTKPGEPVYAMYAEASLYFAADRPPSFKYLWFLGEQRIPHALRDLRKVLAGPDAPRYIVVYQAPRSMPGAVAAGIPAVLKARYHVVERVGGHDVLQLRS